MNSGQYLFYWLLYFAILIQIDYKLVKISARQIQREPRNSVQNAAELMAFPTGQTRPGGPQTSWATDVRNG